MNFTAACNIIFFYFIIAIKIYSEIQLSDEFMRNEVRKTMKEAWRAYKKDAWGYDFLAPQSHAGRNLHGLGYSIVDSLDSLLLMNLTDEFNEAREWVRTNFTMNTTVSLFEATIRCIGSFLSTYEQTGDILFLNRAKELADKMKPAFETETGIPRTLVNLNTGKCQDHNWSIGYSLLADAGSIQLEFFSLALNSGNMEYWDLAENALMAIHYLSPLPDCFIGYNNILFSERSYSVDAFGDSYFEYLAKLCLYLPQNTSGIRHSFRNAMKAATKRLGFTSRFNNLEYFATVRRGSVQHTISHLSYFLPGTLLLAASNDEENAEMYNELADSLFKTSRYLYNQITGLSGDTAIIKDKYPGYVWSDNSFKLRPEHVESLFYLWRLRKDRRAKKEAWKIFMAIRDYAFVEGGYTTIQDIDYPIVIYEDTMDSYFLSETLKYLYLIFSDDSVISLDEYVFTTQAHFLKKRLF